MERTKKTKWLDDGDDMIMINKVVRQISSNLKLFILIVGLT